MRNQAQRKRHAFGQHFLKDQKLCQEIVETFLKEIESLPVQQILEIGPGKGALTFPLLERKPQNLPLTLAEKDRDLIAFWKEKNIPLLEGDFLKQENPLPKGTAILSNLPYSAGTAILVKLSPETERIPFMMLMFQKEVAERLYAPPSTPDRGSLSVWIQNLWSVGPFQVVPPSAFSPPPKVQSEVVLLRPRKTPMISGTQSELPLWESLLKRAFSQRRRMLRGIFKGSPWQNTLEASQVDGTKRAEALDWEEWQALFQALLQHR